MKFSIKNFQFILIVCISLGIIVLCPNFIEAKNTSIGISAVVDRYMAVYKAQDGAVRVEKNITNDYYADNIVCVVNY